MSSSTHVNALGPAAPSRSRRQARSAGREAPEDSVPIRAVVGAIVGVAALALISRGAVPPGTAIGAMMLIPIGFVFSYLRRGERNVVLKVLLAVSLLVALGAFLREIRYVASVDEARVALASLFIWVQVIHSFDLPRLRDLAFSVAASVVVMAEAGSLSLDVGFGLYLIPFSVLVAVWLYLSQVSMTRRTTDGSTVRRPLEAPTPSTSLARRVPWRAVVTTTVVALLAGATIFMVMPRLPGTRAAAPPFSLTRAIPVPDFTGQVVNPGAQTTPSGGISPFLPDAYPGFGSSVDLRSRGFLSDEVVLKVRSAEAAFWRGQAYDTFDGVTWTASDTTTQAFSGMPPWRVPDLENVAEIGAPSHALTQTFFVQRQQPNIAFAAYRPLDLYFPAANAAVDTYASIRTPILLDEGLVYSVVSEVPDATPALLRTSLPRWPSSLREQYTQLPADLPPRVVELARRITDDQPTVYDKVIAVQEWLGANTRYNLNIPPDPPGANAVDHFLFERREGFCEHIASAMAVLLRAVGIPTRFAVGFDSGERNHLTGYFEVRESDAHAWVEVYYDDIGWIEYDPTHEVPFAANAFSQAFVAPQILGAIGRFISGLTPQPVKAALGAAWKGTVALAGWAASSWVLLALAGTVLALGAAAWGRRRRRLRRGPEPTGAAAAFASVCRTFERRGHARSPTATPREYARTLLRVDDVARGARDDLDVVVEAVEREGFAASPPTATEIAAAYAAADRIRERTNAPSA